MADEDVQKKGMDPLKAYCYVLGFLILVLGILWFRIRGERDDYAAANARAEQFLTGKGLPKATAEGRPTSIPDIAYEVEKFVETYKGTAAEGSSGGTGLSLETLDLMAKHANVTRDTIQNERKEDNKTAGYTTYSRQIDYKPTTLWNLLTLVWNIESRGRYRVNEIRWQLADKKDNAQPPFHAIAKPTIKVAIRTPMQKER